MCLIYQQAVILSEVEGPAMLFALANRWPISGKKSGFPATAIGGYSLALNPGPSVISREA